MSCHVICHVILGFVTRLSRNGFYVSPLLGMDYKSCHVVTCFRRVYLYKCETSCHVIKAGVANILGASFSCDNVTER